MSCEIEVDESYFVAYRVRGRCGRVADKTRSVFLFVILFATLQEVAKIYYRVKHSVNEFAKGRNHISEIVNFLLR